MAKESERPTHLIMFFCLIYWIHHSVSKKEILFINLMFCHINCFWCYWFTIWSIGMVVDRFEFEKFHDTIHMDNRVHLDNKVLSFKAFSKHNTWHFLEYNEYFWSMNCLLLKISDVNIKRHLRTFVNYKSCCFLRVLVRKSMRTPPSIILIPSWDISQSKKKKNFTVLKLFCFFFFSDLLKPN